MFIDYGDAQLMLVANDDGEHGEFLRFFRLASIAV